MTDLAPAFVLGALEPAVTHDVRDHLASCPEAHAEFEELGGVMPYLAESVEPVEPPAGLADRIMAAIDAEVRAGRRTDAAADRLIASLGAGSRGPIPADVPGAAVEVSRLAAPPVAGATGPADGGVRSALPIDLEAARRSRRSSRLGWVAAIAAVVLIAALGAWNVGLTSQLSAAQADQAALNRVLAIAQQPGGQAAILVPGVSGGPAGLAAVAADGSFALAVQGLAPTSGTQVYEAWVIAASGTPVPIGSFAVGSNGLGTLAIARAPTGAALTVGLTREVGPGVSTPTLPMVVSGVTSQGS